MNKLANQPAFPHLNPNFDWNWDKEPQRGGLTVRQHFASLAMQAILANQPLSLKIYEHHLGESGCGAIASEAIGMADALIAELEQQPKSPPALPPLPKTEAALIEISAHLYTDQDRARCREMAAQALNELTLAMEALEAKEGA